MELEQIRDTAINLHAWKYKLMAIGGIIVGIVVLIVGIVVVFKNTLSGMILILVGLGLTGSSGLSLKSARRKAEIKAGLHGWRAQERLMKMEKRKK